MKFVETVVDVVVRVIVKHEEKNPNVLEQAINSIYVSPTSGVGSDEGVYQIRDGLDKEVLKSWRKPDE